MKKATVVALILVFTLYLGGVQVFYRFKMNDARRDATISMQSKLSLDKTIELSFTTDEYDALAWSERNKEFTLNGQRYDIASINYTSDLIKLVCYPDGKESDIVAAFSNFMDRMFSAHQGSGTDNNDMASKLCKEYLPNERLVPFFFPRVLTTINTDCVLVSSSDLIGNIWHPPTLS